MVWKKKKKAEIPKSNSYVGLVYVLIRYKVQIGVLF